MPDLNLPLYKYVCEIKKNKHYALNERFFSRLLSTAAYPFSKIVRVTSGTLPIKSCKICFVTNEHQSEFARVSLRLRSFNTTHSGRVL